MGHGRDNRDSDIFPHPVLVGLQGMAGRELVSLWNVVKERGTWK